MEWWTRNTTSRGGKTPPLVQVGFVRSMPALTKLHLLCGRRNLRPVLHLHAREQVVFAPFRLENGCFAFLDVEPVLPECIDDVWLVRNENVVRALVGRPGQHVAQRFG